MFYPFPGCFLQEIKFYTLRWVNISEMYFVDSIFVENLNYYTGFQRKVNFLKCKPFLATKSGILAQVFLTWTVETSNEHATACFIVCSLFINIVTNTMLCFFEQSLRKNNAVIIFRTGQLRKYTANFLGIQQLDLWTCT